MKTTILTIALGLAGLTFAQTPAPTQTPSEKPAASAKTKKHKAKRAPKTHAKAAPSTEQTPVKK